MRKVIITVSLTGGVQSKKETPYLPEQPDEIAADAYACYNEGAAVAHIHARDKNGAADRVMWRYSRRYMQRSARNAP